MKAVGAESQSRVLGPRQRMRAGAALAFAAAEVEKRGITTASGWLEPRRARRSEAEEVLEGILIIAGDAWEERKVRHLGLLYVNLAERELPSETKHYLVRLAERLTYQQLVCLEVLGRDDLRGFKIFEGTLDAGDQGLQVQLEELGQLGLSGFRQEDGRITRPCGTYGGGALEGTDVERLVLTSLGRLLRECMELAGTDAESQEKVKKTLRGV